MQIDAGAVTAELPIAIPPATRPPGAGVPRLPADPAETRRAVRLRRPLRVLGRGHRDCLGRVRAHPPPPTEQPSQRLAGLSHVIAGVRGSPIECYGTMDLLLRNEQGEKWRIMQADQSLYLHPGRARLPTEAMEIGWHDRPDVVLEVDHTTDVRRGKLGLYEAWGFPEVWVDVPEAKYAVRRPAGLAPGLDDPPAGRRRLSDRDAEPGVSGLVRGRDPHGVERSGVVGANQPGAAPHRKGAGRTGGHRPRRHALAAHGAPGVPGRGRTGAAGPPGGAAVRHRHGATAVHAAPPHRGSGPARRGE